MTPSRLRRLSTFALIGLIVFAVLCLAGVHLAARALQAQIVQALGPETEVGDVHLGFSQVVIEKIRLRAPPGWPCEDALRADRIVVEPELRSLFSAQPHIARIAIEGGFISLLRTAGGKLRLLPSLLEKKEATSPSSASGPAMDISIRSLALTQGSVAFYDASVRRPAHLMRLEQVKVTLESLHVPALDTRTRMQLEGVIKGVRQDGTLSIQGWSVLGTREADLTTTLRNVDLVALQPYLIKTSETGVRRGSADLDLRATVKARHLHAPGLLTLSDLQLAGNGTFMGLPRQLVVNAMKDRDQRIRLKFVLDGSLDDPKFSLNENLTSRLTSSLAEHLGISVGGVARGLGSLSGKGLDGIGKALDRLFKK